MFHACNCVCVYSLMDIMSLCRNLNPPLWLLVATGCLSFPSTGMCHTSNLLGLGCGTFFTFVLPAKISSTHCSKGAPSLSTGSMRSDSFVSCFHFVTMEFPALLDRGFLSFLFVVYFLPPPSGEQSGGPVGANIVQSCPHSHVSWPRGSALFPP